MWACSSLEMLQVGNPASLKRDPSQVPCSWGSSFLHTYFLVRGSNTPWSDMRPGSAKEHGLTLNDDPF